MLMQVFVVFSLVTVLWVIYGYSLAFTEGNAYFGSFDRLFLKGARRSLDGGPEGRPAELR
jgi:Amt family ammonium transporter